MKFKENKVISLEGPVEKIGNKLLLRIPLEVGGLDLLDYTRKIGSVVDDDLVIIIPDSLAERLNIKEGNVVNVNNKDGKFNIEPKTWTVLLSEDDWRSIEETLFLLSIPGMRDSIVDGMKKPIKELSDKLLW